MQIQALAFSRSAAHLTISSYKLASQYMKPRWSRLTSVYYEARLRASNRQISIKLVSTQTRHGARIQLKDQEPPKESTRYMMNLTKYAVVKINLECIKYFWVGSQIPRSIHFFGNFILQLSVVVQFPVLPPNIWQNVQAARSVPQCHIHDLQCSW